jgi:glutathione S-transferase
VAVEVFWGSGSPFSWRVLLTLEAKGIPYESHLLEFSRRDHKTPEYLALNPRGQVPTLRDGATIVYESIAIMAYLERRYPEVPLFGLTAEETGGIWRVICETLSYLDQPTEAFTLPIYGGAVTPAEAERVRAALPAIRDELSRLEAALQGRPWLATPALSAADIAVFPIVKSLLRAASKPAASAFEHGLTPFSAGYPALAAWLTRVEALPGYERTTPPHWR